MFVVSEADAAAILAEFEFAAAVELRRRFPGITDNLQARECARTIAAWRPRRQPAVDRWRSPTQSGQRGSALLGATAKK